MQSLEKEIAKGVAKLQSSRAVKEAEKRCDFRAVVFVSSVTPVPRFLGEEAVRPFSSNEFGWNVTTGETGGDPTNYVGDLNGHIVPVKLIAHVWVMTSAHAARVKTRIDRALLGDDEEGRTRKRWRWLASHIDPQEYWEILLRDALDDIELGGEFVETFCDQERKDRIMRESRLRGRV